VWRTEIRWHSVHTITPAIISLELLQDYQEVPQPKNTWSWCLTKKTRDWRKSRRWRTRKSWRNAKASHSHLRYVPKPTRWSKDVLLKIWSPTYITNPLYRESNRCFRTCKVRIEDRLVCRRVILAKGYPVITKDKVQVVKIWVLPITTILLNLRLMEHHKKLSLIDFTRTQSICNIRKLR
jgi:hypothetical protein